MGSGSKKLWAPKLDYSLRRRFFAPDDTPMDWQDIGKGEFNHRNGSKDGLKSVQKQIDILIANGKKVEIEFVHNKQKMDYYGYPTKKQLIFNMGTDAP